MFTGLVQRVGELRRLEQVGDGWSLMIAHEAWPQPLELGESMAVQGACLTVTAIESGFFTADILDETMQRTAMRNFSGGMRVNLERALAMGERLGGHIVSGHVDECGRVVGIVNRGRDFLWRIACSRTLLVTTLGDRREGSEVNLEGDVLGKYVARLLGKDSTGGGVSAAMLTEHGFI